MTPSMPSNQGMLDLLKRRLGKLEDDTPAGPGMLADALRLWNRLGRFIAMGVAGAAVDAQSLELACYALQLPNRILRSSPSARGVKPGLRLRCEQAAELMVSFLEDDGDESLLERTTRLLQETPMRSPAHADARLLADAVNLDDFGLMGLIGLSMQLALGGGGVEELVAAMDKREQYGYWEVRLKESFHFEQVGQIARRRLEEARRISAMLNAELAEDRDTI